MVYLTDSGEWEDNWLFQKSRLKGNNFDSSYSLFYPEEGASICMLVPNPIKGSDSRPSIGNVDIDLVSELSERISVASIDYSSSASCSSKDSEANVSVIRYESYINTKDLLSPHNTLR